MDTKRHEYPRISAEALRHWREQMGMSQSEAYRALQVPRRSWQDWEYGTRNTLPYLRLALAALQLGLKPVDAETGRLGHAPLDDRPPTPEAIVNWRQQLGLTQNEAARQLMSSKRGFADWEYDQRKPPVYLRLAMAAVHHRIPPIDPETGEWGDWEREEALSSQV